MKKLAVFALVCSSMGWAQLTQDEKLQDFQNLASLYAKQYAPFAWKEQLLGYNLFDLKPWIALINKSQDDLSFYEIMEQYVASLDDAHDEYNTPSDFVADLRFRIDIYDGKFLIDRIHREDLPADKFPFQVGDELVMVDNRTPDDHVKEFSSLVAFANPLSQRRYLAALVTERVQALVPRAEEVGDTASVVIRGQDGNLHTYTIPWVKSGTPLTQVGPVPLPQSIQKADAARKADGAASDTKSYLHPLRYRGASMLPANKRKFVLNFGGFNPIFTLPAGFVQRLGKDPSDFFFSGTYKSGTKTIGFIRLADFETGGSNNIFLSEPQFDTEIAYMEQNTDGLVFDIMRNPGGDGCFGEDLMSRLATQAFHGLSEQIRPQIFDVQFADQAVVDAQAAGVGWELAVLKDEQKQIDRAYYAERGMTPQIPVCGLSLKRAPNKDQNGKLAIYDKPVLLLTDEFSASAADFFAAFFQDAQRGKIFGMRTTGAGGSVLQIPYYPIVGFYSEGTASVTVGLGIRAHNVVTPDYPTAPYIENIGVRPDIQNDYMTKDNLLKQGQTFVTAFTKALLGMIK